MFNYTDQLGLEASATYNVLLCYPELFLPPPCIPGVDTKAACEALYGYGLCERKSDGGQLVYQAIRAIDNGEVITAEQMPSVFSRTKRIIDSLKLAQAGKVMASTPMVPARWAKIEHLSDEDLDELLRAMDSYIISKKAKYRDITLVLNNWFKLKQKRRPTHAATRTQKPDW